MEDKKITFLSVNKIDLFLEYYPSLYREYYFNNYIVNFINLKSKKITVYKKKNYTKQLTIVHFFSYIDF